jgi:hypothetical protein
MKKQFDLFDTMIKIKTVSELTKLRKLQEADSRRIEIENRIERRRQLDYDCAGCSIPDVLQNDLTTAPEAPQVAPLAGRELLDALLGAGFVVVTFIYFIWWILNQIFCWVR